MSDTLEKIQPTPMYSESTVPRVDPADYQVLRPDTYHTHITGQEELLEKYIYLINPLIEKIVGNEDEPGFDKVVFLDKSARPLYWLLKDMWPYMAPQRLDESTGEVKTADLPGIKFANIDRLPWRVNPQKEFDEGGMKEVKPDDVEGLRAIFQSRHEGKKSDKSELDNKRILLVDEQSESGDTLKIAKILFDQAFPTSEVKTLAWIWHPNSVERGGQRNSQVKEIPMWYPPKDERTKLQYKDTGRGVLSPVPFDATEPAHGDLERFPASSYQFLSTKPRLPKSEFSEDEQMELARLRNEYESTADSEEKTKLRKRIERLKTVVDPESIQLRKEMGQVALDFKSGKLKPAITTKRIEILGMPPLEYNRGARSVREKR